MGLAQQEAIPARQFLAGRCEKCSLHRDSSLKLPKSQADLVTAVLCHPGSPRCSQALGHASSPSPASFPSLPFPARRHSGLPAPRPAAREGRSWPPLLLCTTRGLSLVNAQPSRKTQEGKHEVTPSWQSRATHAPLGPLFQLWERPRGQAGASSPLLLLHKPRWARLRALGGGQGKAPRPGSVPKRGPDPRQPHTGGPQRSGTSGDTAAQAAEVGSPKFGLLFSPRCCSSSLSPQPESLFSSPPRARRALCPRSM